jgi:hypothetical protein
MSQRDGSDALLQNLELSTIVNITDQSELEGARIRFRGGLSDKEYIRVTPSSFHEPEYSHFGSLSPDDDTNTILDQNRSH